MNRTMLSALAIACGAVVGCIATAESDEHTYEAAEQLSLPPIQCTTGPIDQYGGCWVACPRTGQYYYTLPCQR